MGKIVNFVFVSERNKQLTKLNKRKISSKISAGKHYIRIKPKKRQYFPHC